MTQCPAFERMLIDSGMILIKYWFSISDEEQERRFRKRNQDKKKRWKLSPMDLEARARWVEYSKAKDDMFEHTDTEEAPWNVVHADVKKHARLNCITHLLNQIDYEDVTLDPVELPPREERGEYERPPIDSQNWIPAVYGSNPVDDGD
jgi:polyphosphate kinase 2 (PPK2 family)